MATRKPLVKINGKTRQLPDTDQLFGLETAEKSPSFTYAGDHVSRIDYVSGNYKTFTYVSDVLTQVDYVRPGNTTIQKVFTYNPDGSLDFITQTEV